MHQEFQAAAYRIFNLKRGYASKCKHLVFRNFNLNYLAFPTHHIINMPALSPTMSSGTIGTWNKSVGDRISPGEILVEIETDKAQVDFEFQDEGYIAKILLESGTKDVDIGTVSNNIVFLVFYLYLHFSL